MERKPSILAVDDDLTALTFLSKALSCLPVSLHFASNCREFGDLMGKVVPSLSLIDVELPDGDGFLLLDALRRGPGGPAILLTVHADEAHRLRGLELGAVEYLSKPIHPRELILRVRNLLAATSPRASRASAATTRRFAGLRLDLAQRRLLDGDGNDLNLTSSEFEVLALLTATPHGIVPREAIVQRLGPRSAARHNARIVDILIWRLRRKLGGEAGAGRLIMTIPCRGYMFVADAAPDSAA